MNLRNQTKIDKNADDGAPAVWRWPVLLAAASAFGLISALVGDDGYDVLSWCLLALPLAVVGRALYKRR